MSFKPIDAKRDEYRKYLERTGVMELLSKVILKLFQCPEKPDNAIEFIRSNIGDAMLEKDGIEHVKRELENSRNEVDQLRRQIDELRAENSRLASKSTTADVASATVAIEQLNVDEVISNSEQIAELIEDVTAEKEVAPPGEPINDDGNKEIANELDTSETEKSEKSENDEKKESEPDSEKKDNVTEKEAEPAKAE